LIIEGVRNAMVIRTVLVALYATVFAITASAEKSAVPIVFPKDKSIVGSRVNLVLDPTEIPFFQVIVGETEYPVVDTSAGTHAFQGLELEPGLNTITVKVFTLPPPEEKSNGKGDGNNDSTGTGRSDKNKQRLVLLSTWERQVFSMRGISAEGTVPAGFNKDPFQSRDRETGCSGCHDLETPPLDNALPKDPEEVICYACHRKTPTGKHIHGPAAVWSCLSCHNPDLYPAKYQFESVNPWTVSKSIRLIVPRVFTFASERLFDPLAAAITDKQRAAEEMKDVLAYLKQNPGERMRIEVHTDKKPLPKQKGKKQAFKSNLALTQARARTLAALFKENGMPLKRFTAVGMGDSLAKSPDTTPEGLELNNRVEIVVHPADVKVVNSQKLPALSDRRQVLINLQYAQGPAVTMLEITEKLDKSLQYVADSSYYRAKPLAPAVKGDEVKWELGELEANSAETLVFVVKTKDRKVKSTDEKKEATISDTLNEGAISDTISLSYGGKGRVRSRIFDPKIPPAQSFTIRDACLKCHKDVMRGSFKHGPVDAGYCTVCHDPHASEKADGLRKSVWDLCVTCHETKATERHVLVGVKKKRNFSHPTKSKSSRHGKRLTCSSCHDPHSAESSHLFTFGVKERFEQCRFCHKKKFPK
jgi:predicted CXXCH cytochrome family protein